MCGIVFRLRLPVSSNYHFEEALPDIRIPLVIKKTRHRQDTYRKPHADVASVQPSVGINQLGSLLRILEVTGGYVQPLHANLWRFQDNESTYLKNCVYVGGLKGSDVPLRGCSQQSTPSRARRRA